MLQLNKNQSRKLIFLNSKKFYRFLRNRFSGQALHNAFGKRRNSEKAIPSFTRDSREQRNASRFSRSIGGYSSRHSIRARIIIVVIRRIRPRNDRSSISPFRRSPQARVMDLMVSLLVARFPLRLLPGQTNRQKTGGNKSPSGLGSPFRVNHRNWHEFLRCLARFQELCYVSDSLFVASDVNRLTIAFGDDDGCYFYE